MNHELTSSQLRVLKILSRIKHPIGYFGIMARLELRKRVLHEHLATVLETLTAYGLVDDTPAPGHRFGTYCISAAGRQWLSQELEEPPASGQPPAE
jgi:hypothetical protein